MASSSDKQPHIMVVPFAQQGHINPLMQLSRKLASRGAKVTFVVSENTLRSGKIKSSGIPNLRFVGVADNLSAERSKGSSFRDSVDSMVNMEAGFRELLQGLRHVVTAIICDVFMTWAPSIAGSFSILCISFFTTNATTCALGHQISSLLERGILPFRPEGEEESPLPKDPVQGLEGVPDLPPEDFPKDMTRDVADQRFQFGAKIGETLRQAPALIMNTMQELEPEAVAALRAHKHVYTVGPLLLLSGRQTTPDVNYWPEEHHCLPWLDSKPPSSVLYVSFGSVAVLPLPHFQHLALGLEASEQPFLWVVRPDSTELPLEQALPDGFLARTKDRGLIISWGPQLLILSHPSIGGFFTHGGWNSIIENLCMVSVPMICWPHVAEQHLNRRLVVDHWKVGVRLQHEADDGVTKEEIARVVQDLFRGKHGMELREASSKVGDLTKKAVTDEGSSQNNFEALYTLLTLPKDTPP